MATIFMLLGMPAAGKTTLARQMEHERPALRLSPDDWVARIVGDFRDINRRSAIEQIQMEIAVRALALGVDAVFEQAGWTRAERDRQRAQVATIPGARFELLWLDPPQDELWRRIEARNAALADPSLAMSPALFARFAERFEAPTADEHAHRLGD